MTFYIIVNFILNPLFSFEQPTENYIYIAINIINHVKNDIQFYVSSVID